MIPVTAWPGGELKIGLTPFFFTIFVCYFPSEIKKISQSE